MSLGQRHTFKQSHLTAVRIVVVSCAAAKVLALNENTPQVASEIKSVFAN